VGKGCRQQRQRTPAAALGGQSTKNQVATLMEREQLPRWRKKSQFALLMDRETAYLHNNDKQRMYKILEGKTSENDFKKPVPGEVLPYDHTYFLKLSMKMVCSKIS
jgi:hypothetical protein